MFQATVFHFYFSKALAIADKQKEHFRNTVDDLRRQLESAVATKDAVIRAK